MRETVDDHVARIFEVMLTKISDPSDAGGPFELGALPTLAVVVAEYPPAESAIPAYLGRGPGYDAAEAMGVLPRLQELGYRFEEASWLDETGRRRARLRFEQFGKIEQGRLFSILRPDLEQALRDQLSGSIDLRFAISLSAVHHTSRGVRVTLDDGGTLDADLLVGADGIHSTVRGLVFGDP